jgi:hypothetical protein
MLFFFINPPLPISLDSGGKLYIFWESVCRGKQLHSITVGSRQRKLQAGLQLPREYFLFARNRAGDYLTNFFFFN